MQSDLAQPRAFHHEREPLVRVEHATVGYDDNRSLFRRQRQRMIAVNRVDVAVYPGETLALIGESGSGKSTLGRAVVRLQKLDEGKLYFAGDDITQTRGAQLRALRREMQIIFQDPRSSLSPRMRVLDILTEPLRIHDAKRASISVSQLSELLHRVGLSDEFLHRYPHELSGGQLQRVAIARALVLRPRFIVCDEPVTAVDASTRTQILNLLMDLQEDLGLTYLLISHELAVVQHFAHRVAVMYAGHIVEVSTTEELFAHPRHPYTRVLLAASFDTHVQPLPTRHPERPDPVSMRNPACPFAPRCKHAKANCFTATPPWRDEGPTRVACHVELPAP